MTLLGEILLITAAAVGVVICVSRVPRAASPRRRRLPPQAPRPGQLIRVERLVSSATVNTLGVHAHLRPLLREIASRRLAARGRTLEQLPEPVGRELLGDRLWEIVRPGRPFPEDRDGPGVALEELSAMIDVLERL